MPIRAYQTHFFGDSIFGTRARGTVDQTDLKDKRSFRFISDLPQSAEARKWEETKDAMNKGNVVAIAVPSWHNVAREGKPASGVEHMCRQRATSWEVQYERTSTRDRDKKASAPKENWEPLSKRSDEHDTVASSFSKRSCITKWRSEEAGWTRKRDRWTKGDFRSPLQPVTALLSIIVRLRQKESNERREGKKIKKSNSPRNSSNKKRSRRPKKVTQRGATNARRLRFTK